MNTAYMIAHATHNENGELYSGVASCQSGSELQARTWYQRGWIHVYRAVNAEDREKIADFMEKAVANGFIGYDSNRVKRDTLFNAIFTEGNAVEAVNKSVFCDCSSLVYCALYKTTGKKFIIGEDAAESDAVVICPRTIHFVDYIETQCAGMFEKLSEAQHTNSADGLIRGDIMYADGHVAVWI